MQQVEAARIVGGAVSKFERHFHQTLSQAIRGKRDESLLESWDLTATLLSVFRVRGGVWGQVAYGGHPAVDFFRFGKIGRELSAKFREGGIQKGTERTQVDREALVVVGNVELRVECQLDLPTLKFFAVLQPQHRQQDLVLELD